ncbi:MAG: rhomboid family intramembrane serine protease [Nitrospirae bacterium]|nr:rhomboid family intramembrane serine protease [Nitrospirota bacterium]
MIPLKDTIPRRTFPFITFLLVVMNGLVFLYQLSLPERHLEDLVYLFGLVPARYTHPAWTAAVGLPLDEYWPFVTNMFLHGGWFHLIANMWSLYLFGDNVEDRLGHFRFFLFYLLAGVAANAVHFAVNHDSTLPVIGASGAIAGVMAAYLRLFPFGRIITLFPVFFIPYFFEIPAYIFMGFWFLTQVFSGAASLATAEGGGIAWWAHIGGFAAGFLLIKPLCGRRIGGCHEDEKYQYVYR